MFSCRRQLRVCWKKPCGRMTIALVLLSLPGLVVFSFLVKDYSVTKIMSAISVERANEIFFQANSTKQIMNASLLSGIGRSPSLTAEITKSPLLAAEITQSPVLAAEITKSPLLTAEITKSPPLTAEITKSPALTAEITQSPVLAAEITKSPSLATEIITLRDTVDSTFRPIENSTKQESTVRDTHVKDESSTNNINAQNTTPLSNQNATNSSVASKKFVIFVCDRKMYCYGLGDRQRGIVSVYLLAEVTNRTFGIIMTAPSSFLEFYKPNLVPWDIPSEQLQGKSSVEIVAYGPKAGMGLHVLDFNAKYQQDIVYIRTNHKMQGDLLKNPLYKDKFPAWARVPSWQLFQVSWLRLMTPTETLRQQLNEILVGIAQKLHDEYKVSEILKNSKCCERQRTKTTLCVNSTCPSMEQQETCCSLNNSEKTTAVVKTCSSNETCAVQANIENCSNVVCNKTNTNICNNKTCSNAVITTPLANITNVVTHECVRYLEEVTANVPDLSRMKTFAVKYCNETRPVLAPWASVESIRQKQGYDKVNINLVCVHIRLGRSATLPFEGVRNKPNTVKAVWEFLKTYLANGQHVYLATDSQEVRQQAKDMFGDRVHVSSVPIAHIAVIQKGQDERSAFSLTLVEQLLLVTSCKTLIISYSGFSMKAAQLRSHLPGGAWDLYIFKDGMVQPKGVKWLLK